jgi:hypothetical protein
MENALTDGTSGRALRSIAPVLALLASALGLFAGCGSDPASRNAASDRSLDSMYNEYDMPNSWFKKPDARVEARKTDL